MLTAWTSFSFMVFDDLFNSLLCCLIESSAEFPDTACLIFAVSFYLCLLSGDAANRWLPGHNDPFVNYRLTSSFAPQCCFVSWPADLYFCHACVVLLFLLCQWVCQSVWRPEYCAWCCSVSEHWCFWYKQAWLWLSVWVHWLSDAMGDVITSGLEWTGISFTGVDVACGVTVNRQKPFFTGLPPLFCCTAWQHRAFSNQQLTVISCP